MKSNNRKFFFCRIRNIIQICFLVLTLGIGLQFFIYVYQASSGGNITVARPPGVEAFLPIGALIGWKQFFTEWKWDMTHPAAMVILGFAVFISLLFRKTFCGWICPVGTVSEWIWKTGHLIFKKNFRLPGKFDYTLRSIKYVLLGFFMFVIFSMSSADTEAFLNSPYYKTTDVKMLFFFMKMSITTLLVLVFLFLASLLIKNFWCRYLCPYGGLLGLMAFISPAKIERDKDRCISCGKCSRYCPGNLPVDTKKKIRSPECIGCMECVKACPVDRTLEMKILGKSIREATLAIVISLIFLLTIFLAQITGTWKGNVKDHEIRMMLKSINSSEYSHPGL